MVDHPGSSKSGFGAALAARVGPAVSQIEILVIITSSPECNCDFDQVWLRICMAGKNDKYGRLVSAQLSASRGFVKPAHGGVTRIAGHPKDQRPKARS